MPQVAAKVLELVRDPNSSAKDFQAVISRDQALAAKVLKIANSALFGVRGTISTVSRAVVILGFNTLRSLVLAASTEAIYRTRNSRLQDKMLWEHALAVALGARFLAREVRYPEGEQAFLGGLLHDIGKSVLDKNLGEGYGRVVEHVYNDGVTFLDAENEILGFDHTEVGSLVVRKWNLVATLEEAVRCHHSPMRAELDPKLCALISLANAVCVKLGIGPEQRPDLDLPSLDAALMLTIDPERLAWITETVQEKLEEEKELFRLG